MNTSALPRRGQPCRPAVLGGGPQAVTLDEVLREPDVLAVPWWRVV